jgi:dihydroorotate dehydrogenase electron transfer subunit
MPIVHKGTVVDNKKVGSYFVLTATAADMPKEFKPGNFVAVAIGDERSSLILRRAFSIYQVNDRGVYGGTVDIVVSPHGPGTDYIASLKRNDPINLVGPLGKPFSLPKDPVPCVLVGGGYGAAL